MREPKNQLKPTGSYPADMSTGGTAEATQAGCGIVPCIIATGLWLHLSVEQCERVDRRTLNTAVEIITSVLLTNAPPPIQDLPIPLE